MLWTFIQVYFGADNMSDKVSDESQPYGDNAIDFLHRSAPHKMRSLATSQLTQVLLHIVSLSYQYRGIVMENKK